MALLRISLAVAVGLICSGANAQERESPFGGGPIVYGGDHRISYLIASAADAFKAGQNNVSAETLPGQHQRRAASPRSGGKGRGGGGRGAGGRGGGHSGRN